jgi:hypothetical protein
MPIGTNWRSLRRQELEQRTKQNFEMYKRLNVPILGVTCNNCEHVNPIENNGCCSNCTAPLKEQSQQ